MRGGNSGVTFDQVLWLAMTEKAGDNFLFIKKFGRNGDLAANVEEDVWSVGGVKVFLDTAEQMSLVSTSTSDAVGGTGAVRAVILGVNDDWDLISETVTLTGTTPVVTTNSFLDINRIAVIDAGSTESNVGTITATSNDTAVITARVEATRGVTEHSHTTVPRGYVGFIVDEDLNVFRSSGGSGAKSAEFDAHFRAEFIPGAGRVTFQTERTGLNNQGTGSQIKQTKIEYQLRPKSRFWYRVIAETNGTAASTKFGILLVKGEFVDNITII